MDESARQTQYTKVNTYIDILQGILFTNYHNFVLSTEITNSHASR
jgi:hypothetical protein